MREVLKCFIACLIIIVWGIGIYGTASAHTYELPKKPVNESYEIVELPEPEKVEQVIPEVRMSTFRTYTAEDQAILEGIARAEAGNQGVEGMLLVMNVVMNRCERNGQSISEVVYAPNQFYTAGMCEGNDESFKALMLLMQDVDYSQGAIYFCSTGWNQYGNEHLFKFGDHYFSK